MEKLKAILNKYFFFWLALLLIPACWALFIPGYFGASDDIHIAWLYELHKTIMMGKIPPRFVPDLSFGFGYPLFNFVFPLPFYIAEIFHLLGLSLVDSIKALFFITIPISLYFMYSLLREFTNKALSLAGAVLYIYTPYRAVDLYVRGAIGEIVSFVFLPAILLSLIKIKKSDNLGWVGIGGLSLAFLVLSHNITAYLFFPFLMLFILLQLIFLNNKWQFLYRIILMIILALLISIYFWLPALLDSKLMKHDTVFNFADHFPTILQLITPYWGYGASVPGPYDGIPFFLGSTNLLVLGLGLLFLVTHWRKYSLNQKIILSWAVISIFCVVFLMNHRSTFVWNSLPFLTYFQFPWRFLILTTFAIPILVISLDNFSQRGLLAVILIFLTIITNGSFFRPQDFLGRTDTYFINRYIPTPVAKKEYLETQEEYLRLPKNTKIRPDRNFPLVYSEEGTIENITKINELDTLIDVDSKMGMKLNFSKYFFPGWVAQIDGQSVTIVIGDPYGQILIDIPAGMHKIKIAFEETNFRKILNAISLISFLVSLGLVKNLWLRLKIYGRTF